MIEVGSLAARDLTPRRQPTSLSGTSVPEAYLDVPLSNLGWNYRIRNRMGPTIATDASQYMAHALILRGMQPSPPLPGALGPRLNRCGFGSPLEHCLGLDICL